MAENLALSSQESVPSARASSDGSGAGVFLSERSEWSAAVPTPRLQSLTVFFPAYNERGNIGVLVTSALEVLPRIAGRFEVIIVDDGSTDGTAELADELAQAHAGLVRAIHHCPNRGYGAALKSGLDAAQNEWVFFTDGDGQFRLEELPEFVDQLKPGIDLLVGFRKKRSDPWYRSLNARLYKGMIRMLFGLRVRDLDCAFKLIHRRVLDSVKLKSNGALVSAELLIKASRRGFTIAQVGVNHYPRLSGQQTGAKLSVILRMFWELLRNYRDLRSRE
jgi:glycosyltransferase involved in cell wall biosynthesis